MDDLGEKITQILNDPGSMQQIMQIANALGGQQTEEHSSSPPPPPNPIASPEILSNITNLLQLAEKTDKKQEALFQALRPFLRPSRQERLDRAIQIAHLSHLAGIAFRSGKVQIGAKEEVKNNL